MSQEALEAGSGIVVLAWARAGGLGVVHGAQGEDGFIGFPSAETPHVRTSRESHEGGKMYFQAPGPWGQAPVDLGKGSRALGAVLSGLRGISPESLGPGL